MPLPLRVECHSCPASSNAADLIEAAELGWALVQGISGSMLFVHCPDCYRSKQIVGALPNHLAPVKNLAGLGGG